MKKKLARLLRKQFSPKGRKARIAKSLRAVKGKPQTLEFRNIAEFMDYLFEDAPKRCPNCGQLLHAKLKYGLRR